MKHLHSLSLSTITVSPSGMILVKSPIGVYCSAMTGATFAFIRPGRYVSYTATLGLTKSSPEQLQRSTIAATKGIRAFPDCNNEGSAAGLCQSSAFHLLVPFSPYTDTIWAMIVISTPIMMVLYFPHRISANAPPICHVRV